MSALEQALSHFEAGDFGKAREAAMEGLRGQPDDVELLRVAGRAGVELGSDDAVDQLRKVAELQPDSAESWHDLGDSLAADGRTEEAAQAFRKVLEINPDDELALTHLGHTEYATGGQDAVAHLEQAAERTGGMSTAAISLVEMYKSMNQPEEALHAAQKVLEAEPEDVVAMLDVAELSLELGRHDDAVKAFERLRELEDLPDHEVYALHGMIQAELKREEKDRALELAREAAPIDQYGRTASVLLFLAPDEVEQPENGEPKPAPSAEDVDAALAESLKEHRRLHAEDGRLLSEDLLG